MKNISCGVYFDTRTERLGNVFTIYFRLRRKKNNIYIASGFSASRKEFDGKYFVGRGKEVRAMNDAFHDKYEEFVEWCEDFNGRGLTNAQVKQACEDDLFPERKEGGVSKVMMLTKLVDEYIEKCVHTEGTKVKYRQVRNKVSAYGDVDINGVTADWLRGFDKWMEVGDKFHKALMINSRSSIMRGIRSCINYALAEEYMEKYPFKKFKIREEETPMRVLTREEIITLRDYPCATAWQAKARDMWMLSFYLFGINNGDLFTMRKLTKGRCQYRRGKTHRLYDIAVPDEAMEIIERYKGKDFLLDVCDTNKDYHSYVKHLNESLKTIGMEIRNGVAHKGKALFPGLTMYWARYSAATLMAEIDVPMETISQCLGHSSGLRVTQIYVKFQQKKIDEAQKRMIDALNGA